jgi:hypothetical protein
MKIQIYTLLCWKFISFTMAHSYDSKAYWNSEWPIEFFLKGPWAHSEKNLQDHWRWLSHMEQELFTLREHLNSSLIFIGVRVAQSKVLLIIVCPLHCLSFFRFTTFNYPFGIFKLFLNQTDPIKPPVLGTVGI